MLYISVLQSSVDKDKSIGPPVQIAKETRDSNPLAIIGRSPGCPNNFGSVHLLAQELVQLVFVCFCYLFVRLLRKTAASIHPVTTGHGDAVVHNFLCPAEHVDSPPWSSL